ncbi:hypothetical protein Tco_1117287 [Tanacetum coccineum]
MYDLRVRVRGVRGLLVYESVGTVGGVRVCGVKVRGVQVGGVRVRGVRDGGVRVGGVRVGVVRVGGVRVDGVRVGGVRFGGVRVSGVRVRGIMAALAIAISSDSSDESVGSSPSRVILFGDIPIVIPSTFVVAPETSYYAPIISSAAPVVETTLVASPTGLCGLVPYSGSDSDSPDEMSSPEHISPLPAISPFLCTDSSEAPDSSDGPPSIRRRSVILYSTHGRLLPFGHLTTKTLTGRSSSDSSPVYSLGLDASDQAHSGYSTRDVSPRLCYPPRRAPRRIMGSLSYSCWISYQPLKRFRDSYSFEASIEEDTEIDPIETEVDMELGISDEDDVRDHVEIDPRDVRDDTEEYEADTSAGDMVEVGINPMSAPIVEEEIVELAREDSFD